MHNTGIAWNSCAWSMRCTAYSQNAYKTLNADGNAKLDERRCAHLLAGLVASGCLDEKPLENKAGCVKRPATISAKPARATSRAALYTPLVGIDHAWLQVRASARASRRESYCEQLHIDRHAGKLRFKMRIRSKMPMSTALVVARRRLKRPQPQARGRSVRIRSAVEDAVR